MKRTLHKAADRQVILVDRITADDLIRRPRRSRVEAIARSMAESGQRTVIEVCPIAAVDELVDGRSYRLTSGWVRLEAAKLLGWESIQAEVRRGTRAERREREIDDNLLGDGNTVLDRARYLAAGKALYEAQHPETRHGGARRGVQVANIGDLKSYADWAAERYGLAVRSVQRACTIGEYLDTETVHLLAEKPWADHQRALEALSRLSPPQQQAVAGLLTRDPDPVDSLAEALQLVVGAPPAEPDKKRWSAALSNFASMGQRQRSDWLRHLVDDRLVPSWVSITFTRDV